MLGEEYEFTIGFQELKGLVEDGTYGVAWRKGSETGRTKKVESKGKEAALGSEVAINETKRPAGQKAKQLLEVYVNKYGSHDAKQTIGMLYMDLSMHIPKPGKPAAKQSACLQLSNCVDPSIRLSLTVQCHPKAAAEGQSEDMSQVVKQLRDEVSHLRRQNERLKEEESYTWSNQPVRNSNKSADETIASLKAQLADAKARESESAEALAAERGNVQTLLAAHASEIAALKKRHEDALAAVQAACSAKLGKVVENSRVKGDAFSLELDDVTDELADARKTLATLRQRLAEQERQREHAEQGARQAREGQTAVEQQKMALAQRLAEANEACLSLRQQLSAEKEGTDEAKDMLEGLMRRLKESQMSQESLQCALSVAEEEKVAVIRKCEEAQQARRALEKQASGSKSDPASLLRVTDLQKEVATNRVRLAETEQRLQTANIRLDEAAKLTAVQAAKLTQRKKRVLDLKRILGLHLQMKQTQLSVQDLHLPDHSSSLGAALAPFISTSSQSSMVPAP
ncbi:hypothetical protein DIPPA_24650 [Diplonema papillatum]|nr:hypothetical protein DIPPA_24650 [Diplonema papillatum]